MNTRILPATPKSRALTSVLLICCTTSAVMAQTSETLLSILEQKGILSSDQVSAVREEAVKREAGIEKAKTSTPAPTQTLRVAGELRLRYEGFYGENPAFVDRNRFRLRLRAGATADLSKNVEVGLRLTTGVQEGEPTGNNATLTDNASKKTFALDLAYAKWTFLKSKESSAAVTGGKMNNPFVTSDLVFDADYTPEGFAIQSSRALNAVHSVKGNAAYFILDELSNSSDDPFLTGAQVRVDSAWSSAWSTTAGVTAMAITHPGRLTNSAVPDVHKGNTRTSAGGLVNDYRSWIFDLGATRMMETFPGYPGAFPVRVSGDFMTNSGADADNHAYYAGIYLGKAVKKGTWEFNYRYRVIEADAWYEELADSDSGAFYQAAPAGGSVGYGGGTNVRGNIVAGNYAVTDFALVGFTFFDTRLIKGSPVGSETAMRRLQVNTILKF